MKNREIGFSKTLFYLLGAVATVQLLSIGKITVFNIILMVTAIITFLMYIYCLKIDIFFVISFIISLITLFSSICNETLTSGFKNSAIINGFIYIVILIVYLTMNSNIKFAEKFIQGFKFSCKLTLFWCILQVLLFYIFHLDLNYIFFGNMLKISDGVGDYYNGVLIPTGFYSHRAVLIPTLIFLFFSTKNICIITLIIVIGLLTRSTALIIGLLLAVIFRLLIVLKQNFNKRISRRNVLLYLIILTVFAFLCFLFHSRIEELFQYVIVRITDSSSNKADNSSVVHFLYYKNLYPIMKNLNFHNILFGSGFGTSGLHFTNYSGQYANLSSWVVESDYVNILLNQGVIGFVIWCYPFVKIIILSKRYEFLENIAFILIIAFVGIMYNIQFSWFIISELAVLILTKNKICIFK